MYAWTCRSCMLFATKSVRYWSLPWQKTQFEAQLQILQRVHHWSMVGVLFHIFLSFSSLVPEMSIGRSSSPRTSFPLLFVCLAKNLFDSPKMLSTLLMLENKRSIVIVVFKKKNHIIWFIHMITIWKLFCVKWDVMTVSIQLATNVPEDLHIPIAFEFSVRQDQGLAMAITIWGKELLKPILKCVNLF